MCAFLISWLLLAGASATSAELAFRHPGVFDTREEFAKIGQAVQAGRYPWADEFARMRANHHDHLDYASIQSPCS